MESQNNFKQIEHENSQAVISFDNGATFKINVLVNKINQFFIQLVLNNLAEQLKKHGLGIPPNHKGSCEKWKNSVEAEILEPTSGKWQKGKMRMRVILEFCPDEPEEIVNNELHYNNNSLDDIRQSIR